MAACAFFSLCLCRGLAAACENGRKEDAIFTVGDRRGPRGTRWGWGGSSHESAARKRRDLAPLLPCFLPVCNHGIALGQPEETSDEHLAARPGGSKVTPLVTSAFCLEHTSPSFPVCAAKYCGGPFSPWSAGEDSSGLNDPPAHKVGFF